MNKRNWLYDFSDKTYMNDYIIIPLGNNKYILRAGNIQILNDEDLFLCIDDYGDYCVFEVLNDKATVLPKSMLSMSADIKFEVTMERVYPKKLIINKDFETQELCQVLEYERGE